MIESESFMTFWDSFQSFWVVSDFLTLPDCFARVTVGWSEPVCYRREEWMALIDERLAFPRSEIEWFRLEWTEKWRSMGVDPTSWMEELLFNSKRAGDVTSTWIRWGGWVHLTHSTGIHWWGVRGVWDRLLKLLAQASGCSEWMARLFRELGFASLVLFAAMLVGMKPGFFRPMVLMLFRGFARRSGGEFSRIAVILFFLAVEFIWIGRGNLSGGAHYAAALLGAWCGSELAHERGERGWREHGRVSLYSWLTCLPFEWMEGRVNPVTPLISWISVPLLAGWVFPFALVMVITEFCFGFGQEWLGGVCSVLSIGIYASTEFLSRMGIIHQVSGPACLGAFLGAVVLVAILQGRFLKGRLKRA